MKSKLTIPELAEKKRAGEKLVMVAAGDFLTARWAEQAGIDIIGVGDSLGMTIYGHENTLQVTVEQMIHHAQAVRAGAPNTMCLLAMPYGSYPTREIAAVNAVRMMKESGADAVKLQGGRANTEIIRAVVDAGVPVMSHVGMLPHRVHHYGGFKSQGHTAEDALEIIDNARAIEEAGAVGMEVEAVPYEVGKAVDQAVSIFTFFIGAGAAGSCQALNAYDLIGSFDSFKPKFVKRYGNVAKVAVEALEEFAEEVRNGKFPNEGHSYKMDSEEAENLAAALNNISGAVTCS